MGHKKGKKKVQLFKSKKNSTPQTKIIQDLQAQYDTIDVAKIKTFSDLPLSTNTLSGLKESNFIEPTDVQKQCIGLALSGNDILGAARTGSGKTLAFLIPVLEKLYCLQWSKYDGIGAIIISPTRELAQQIHENLTKVGKYHHLTAALIIGGKDYKFEKSRIDQCNIMICTPGRLLHHMNVNPLFNCVSMQIVVLDEADRCLDMGFANDMNAIIENLPPERQTLLFSATQTKSVDDLARLSLRDPIYISVHEHAKYTTPEGLQQCYVVCKLEDKMAMLWSFIKNHIKHKIIIFLSSCKQVKYTYEAFCRMRPGISLVALYSTLSQHKRMAIYETFKRQERAVLFATDIAARGLDFPAVHWVIQMDCPEDANAYIHRAGRTARFQSGGNSVLVLLPSELEMIDRLAEKKIPIEEIHVDEKKWSYPNRTLESLLARDVNLKESAQRAFVSYVKSVFFMKDKKIFDINALNTDAYARSLGLVVSPRIRFLERKQKNEEKNKVHSMKKNENVTDTVKDDVDSENQSDSEEESDDEKTVHVRTKDNSDAFLFAHENDESDSEDDFLKIKRKNVEIENDDDDDDDMNVPSTSSKNKKALTKAAVAKKFLRKKILPNTKTVFDDEGQQLLDPTKTKVSELAKQYENEEAPGINIELAKQVLREEDKFDKERFRTKIKEKHREERRKKKNKKQRDDDEEYDDSDVEDESDGPDLSWLPDPDKIYGPKKDSSADDESNHSELDEQLHIPTKRKLITNDKLKKNQRKKLKITENSDLMATEELALHLLQS